MQTVLDFEGDLAIDGREATINFELLEELLADALSFDRGEHGSPHGTARVRLTVERL